MKTKAEVKNTNSFREFAKYASLNVTGMLGLSCYILADTFFVSKNLGANGLTALNLAIPIYSFINGIGLMLGMGGATKYSILKSQKAVVKGNHTFTNTVMAALCVAALFFSLGLFFSEGIALFLGADEVVFEMSRTYLQVILLFSPAFILNNVLLCFVRNDGAPQLSMAAMLGGSLSNIILDYVFMFPLGMGILGAVLATGLAPLCSILILSPFFLKKKNLFRLIKCRVSLHLCKSILSGGLPSLITEVSSGIVILIFNGILLGLEGNIGVAAYGVIANLSLVVIAIYTGIAQGIQPIISRQHGAGNHGETLAVLKYALVTLVILSGTIYSIVYFGAGQITGIFNSEQNKTLHQIAVTGLKIYFTGGLFAGFNIILSVYFTSTENPLPAHIISILRGFLVIIPLAFLLSAIGGILGVWWVFPTTELIVSVFAGLLYLVHRQKKKPLPGD